MADQMPAEPTHLLLDPFEIREGMRVEIQAIGSTWEEITRVRVASVRIGPDTIDVRPQHMHVGWVFWRKPIDDSVRYSVFLLEDAPDPDEPLLAELVASGMTREAARVAVATVRRFDAKGGD